MANFVGRHYAVACSSGREAIYFSLLASGIRPSDEVLVPDFACQILPITVFCAGAIPKFCDIERRTLALSKNRLVKYLTPHTKAIIFVHPYGMAVDPSSIVQMAQKRGIVFIDDAAQALGAKTGGKMASSFGDVGILSFNKFLKVNLGAAAVTDCQELSEKIRTIRDNFEYRSFFVAFSYWTMGLLGLDSKKLLDKIFWLNNYISRKINELRKKKFQIVDGWVKILPELHRGLGFKALSNCTVNQLWAYSKRYYHGRKMERQEIEVLISEFKNVTKYLERRKRIAEIYENCIEERGVSKFVVPKGCTPSYFRFPILFLDEKRRLKCIESMTKEGFHIDYIYKPLHFSPFSSSESKMPEFAESNYVAKHLLPLPISDALQDEEVQRIISIVNSATQK